MFICSHGNHVSEPREKLHKVVTKKRQRQYVNGDRISVGWEIVKEEQFCALHALPNRFVWNENDIQVE